MPTSRATILGQQTELNLLLGMNEPSRAYIPQLGHKPSRAEPVSQLGSGLGKLGSGGPEPQSDVRESQCAVSIRNGCRSLHLHRHSRPPHLPLDVAALTRVVASHLTAKRRNPPLRSRDRTAVERQLLGYKDSVTLLWDNRIVVLYLMTPSSPSQSEPEISGSTPSSLTLGSARLISGLALGSTRWQHWTCWHIAMVSGEHGDPGSTFYKMTTQLWLLWSLRASNGNKNPRYSGRSSWKTQVEGNWVGMTTLSWDKLSRAKLLGEGDCRGEPSESHEWRTNSGTE